MKRIVGAYFSYRYIYTLILLMIVAGTNDDKEAYENARKELFNIKYSQNEYTKMILDNNHGKLKSFVLRRILPINFYITKMITNVVL